MYKYLVTFPVAISMTTHPTDQISEALPGSLAVMTSGAINAGMKDHITTSILIMITIEQ